MITALMYLNPIPQSNYYIENYYPIYRITSLYVATELSEPRGANSVCVLVGTSGHLGVPASQGLPHIRTDSVTASVSCVSGEAGYGCPYVSCSTVPFSLRLFPTKSYSPLSLLLSILNFPSEVSLWYLSLRFCLDHQVFVCLILSPASSLRSSHISPPSIFYTPLHSTPTHTFPFFLFPFFFFILYDHPLKLLETTVPGAERPYLSGRPALPALAPSRTPSPSHVTLCRHLQSQSC